MKNKLLIGLGTTVAIAAPAIAVVSCSMGSVFKDKIKSVAEARRDINKLFNELSNDGKLSNDVLKYTTYMSLDHLNRDIKFEDSSGNSLDKKELIGMTFNSGDMTTTKDSNVWGYRDWTGMHNDYSGTLPVKLKNGDHADVSIYFKYQKTHGAYFGKHSMLYNVGVGIYNAVHEWEHEIDKIKIVKK